MAVYTARWMTAEWENVSPTGEDSWAFLTPCIREGRLSTACRVTFAEDVRRKPGDSLRVTAADGTPLPAAVTHAKARPALRKIHRFTLELPLERDTPPPDCLHLRLTVFRRGNAVSLPVELHIDWE